MPRVKCYVRGAANHCAASVIQLLPPSKRFKELCKSCWQRLQAVQPLHRRLAKFALPVLPSHWLMRFQVTDRRRRSDAIRSPGAFGNVFILLLTPLAFKSFHVSSNCDKVMQRTLAQGVTIRMMGKEIKSRIGPSF